MALFTRVRRDASQRQTARAQEVERSKASTRVDPLSLAFGMQREAIECRHPFVALCCSGRSGKSQGAVIKWLEVAERKPGEMSVFIALTAGQAKRIAWRQLKKLDKKHSLGLKFNKQSEGLTITHPNGSTLLLLGANRDDLIDVLRGTPFVFVYFDEAAFFRDGLLKTAIEDALLVRMLDLQGEMWVGSTPGYVMAGYHFDLVTGTKPGWRVFHWTYFDNPHLPELPWEPDAMKRRLLRIEFARQTREQQGWTEETPSYVRDFLGKYARDLSALVYAYRPEHNDIEDMPASWYSERHLWHTVLGIDFGSTAATAWVLWAFKKHSPICYAVMARKEYGMAPSATADVTKSLIDTYHPDLIVGDSAAKSYIDEHRIRHRIAIQGADKLGKRAHQMLMNDNFRTVPEARIRIVAATCGALTSELTKLGKDKRYGIHHEKYGIEDEHGEKDAADAGLYGWHRCLAWVEEYRAVEAAKAEAEAKRRLDPLGNTALQGIYGKPPPVAHEGMKGAFGLPGLAKRLRR